MVVERAYETCLRLARGHYENFPVASRLLPKAARPHIAAVYAFARVADDIADEGERPAAVRISLLEQWQWRLREAVAGRVEHDESDETAVFTALGATIRAHRLEVGLFEDLLSAFCQDVLVARYEKWADLLDYCRRSANPIGRLVLRITGYRSDELDRYSDAICTALQLTNFWQDLVVDWQKGRLYVPLELVREAGATEDDLARGTWSDGWRSALGEAAARTRALYVAGKPLPDRVSGRLRLELRATWLGGSRILDRLEAQGFDVGWTRPTLGWRDVARLGWRMARWR